MATQGQSFPTDAPLIDPQTGGLSLVWFRFFLSLWTRSGGPSGNNSANFLYPTTPGISGQVLTSQGANTLTIWTNPATKVSQLTNDTGFITDAALTNFSTTAQTQVQTQAQIQANLGTTLPAPDSTNGAVGISANSAHADHSHPRELNPNFAGIVRAQGFIGNAFATTQGPTWTAGNGAPTVVQPNASLFSRTDGATGTRIYVSNGTTWTPIPAV